MRLPLAVLLLPTLAAAQVVTPPTPKSPPFKNVRTEPPEPMSEELREALQAREREAQERFERRAQEREQLRRRRELAEMRQERRDLLLTRIAHIPVPEVPVDIDRPAEYVAVEMHPMLDDEQRREARGVLAERQERLRSRILADAAVAELFATGGLQPERLTTIDTIQDARFAIEPYVTNPENDAASELFARGVYDELEHVMHEQMIIKHTERRQQALRDRVGEMGLATIGEFTSQMLRMGAAEAVYTWQGLVADTREALASERPLPEVSDPERLEAARQAARGADEEDATAATEALLADLSREDRQSVLAWAAEPE